MNDSSAIYPLPLKSVKADNAASVLTGFGLILTFLPGLIFLMSVVTLATGSKSPEKHTVVLAVSGLLLLLGIGSLIASHWTLRAVVKEKGEETARLERARQRFLVDRGVELAPGDVDEFWPTSSPDEDCLVSMAKGIVNDQAATLALYWRDGQAVLKGTDGQELLPLRKKARHG